MTRTLRHHAVHGHPELDFCHFSMLAKHWFFGRSRECIGVYSHQHSPRPVRKRTERRFFRGSCDFGLPKMAKVELSKFDVHPRLGAEALDHLGEEADRALGRTAVEVALAQAAHGGAELVVREVTADPRSADAAVVVGGVEGLEQGPRVAAAG